MSVGGFPAVVGPADVAVGGVPGYGREGRRGGERGSQLWSSRQTWLWEGFLAVVGQAGVVVGGVPGCADGSTRLVHI